MVNKHFFEAVLMLLASSTILSLELKPFLFQQRMVNRESFKLLKSLRSSSLQQCLPHRKNFLLPHKSVNPQQFQKRHTLAILHEMLQQIFNLFSANVSLDDWEKHYKEKFLIELHEQLDYLEGLMELEAEQKNDALDSEDLRLHVKKYFRRILNYLESHKYSSCAWTIVQIEIKRCLFLVLRLIGKLSTEGMDS